MTPEMCYIHLKGTSVLITFYFIRILLAMLAVNEAMLNAYLPLHVII